MLNDGNTVALFVVVPALLTGIAALWQQKRGGKSDAAVAAKTITEAATELITQLRTEIASLRTEVADLRLLAVEWKVLTEALESEIIELGGDPQRIIRNIRQRYDDPR